MKAPRVKATNRVLEAIIESLTARLADEIDTDIPRGDYERALKWAKTRMAKNARRHRPPRHLPKEAGPWTDPMANRGETIFPSGGKLIRGSWPAAEPLRVGDVVVLDDGLAKKYNTTRQQVVAAVSPSGGKRRG